MKRAIVIAVSLLILAVIWFYLDGKDENQRRDKSGGLKSPAAAGGKSPAISDQAAPSNKTPTSVLTIDDLKVLSPTAEEHKNMLDTPVVFYGQVLDQHDTPVKGASIKCSWPMMGPMESPIERLTAADGRFEIKDIKAMVITILVYPPEGYQRVPREGVKSRGYIQIADPPDRIKRHEYYKALPQETKSQMFIAEAYEPDKNKPITFRLQRLER